MSRVRTWIGARWGRIRADLRRHAVFWSLFGALSVAASVPLWTAELLPQGDLYSHLAMAAVLHDYDTPGTEYAALCRLPTGIPPNVLYYYAVDLFGHVLPLPLANKVVLNLYVVLLPLSLVALLTAFRRNRNASLLAFLFLYNGMFRTGMVNYLIAIPIYFFAIAVFYRFVGRPTWRRGVATALLAGLVYLGHAQMYLLYLLTAAFIALLSWGGLRRLLLAALPPAASLALFVPWFVQTFVTPHEARVAGLGTRAVFKLAYEPLAVYGPALWNYLGADYFAGQAGTVLQVLAVALIAIGLVLRFWEGAPLAADDTPLERRWTRRYLPELLALLLGVTMFALPAHVTGQSIIAKRHVVLFALALLPLLGGFRDRTVAIALSIAAAVLGVVQAGFVRDRFRAFDAELDGYARLFEPVRDGTRLYLVARPRASRVAGGNVMVHLHANFVVWRHGIVNLLFMRQTHNPVTFKPDRIPPDLPKRPGSSPRWTFYDYFLVQKGEGKRIDDIRKWLRPVSENKTWVLFERTGPPSAPRTAAGPPSL